MFTDLALTTVALPLALGLAVGGLAAFGARGTWLTASAIVVSIVVVQLVLDGPPTIPPVSSKHRLGLVLVAGVPVFAALGAFLSQRAEIGFHRLGLIAIAILVLAPLVWIGRTVVFADPASERLVPFVIYCVLASASLVALALAGARLEGGHSAAVGASVLFSSVSGAFIAVSGGYIGMGQMLGVVAAFAGGMLLVAYGRFLAGVDRAFSLGSVPALALGWLCLTFTGVTMLFAPSPSFPALLVQVAVLAVPLVVAAVGRVQVPRWVIPIVFGLLPGGLAVVAVGLAYTAT